MRVLHCGSAVMHLQLGVMLLHLHLHWVNCLNGRITSVLFSLINPKCDNRLAFYSIQQNTVES